MIMKRWLNLSQGVFPAPWGVYFIIKILRHHILTHKFHNDARHIAIATGAGADLLVSWNFKHIVRFDKIQKFNAVNIEMGYKPISIYSPREVTTYGRKSS